MCALRPKLNPPPIESTDTFVCAKSGKTVTYAHCIENLVDCIALEMNDRSCYKCSQGLAARKKFGEIESDAVRLHSDPETNPTRLSGLRG